MANLYDNRRENLRRLIEQWGGPSALGAKLGYADDQKAASPRICPRRLLCWVSAAVIAALVWIADALTIV